MSALQQNSEAQSFIHLYTELDTDLFSKEDSFSKPQVNPAAPSVY